MNKRKRLANFCLEEKDLILKWENKHVLENKESNAVTRKDKNKCWIKISDQYNSSTSGGVSTCIILCILFAIFDVGRYLINMPSFCKWKMYNVSWKLKWNSLKEIQKSILMEELDFQRTKFKIVNKFILWLKNYVII